MQYRLFFLSMVVLSAQDRDPPWKGLNPPGAPVISLRLLSAAPHTFRQGELIPAELILPREMATQGSGATEIWQLTGYLVDPPTECGTPKKPCFGREPFLGFMNGPRSFPEPAAVFLHSVLPARALGRYSIAAVYEKQVIRSRGPGSVSYGFADPRQYRTSSIVAVDVIAPSEAWVRQTISASFATLRGPPPSGLTGDPARHQAALQLAALNHPEAWKVSLEALPLEENTLLGGLYIGQPAAEVCELMQGRIPLPSQSVSQGYLYRLTDICARAKLPEPPRSPAIIAGATLSATITTQPQIAPVSPDLKAWGEKRQAFTEGLMRQATDKLAQNLGNKEAAVKWDVVETLLQRVNQVRHNLPREADPAWVSQLTDLFVRDYATIDLARKRYLLEQFTATIDSPALAPMLESILDQWKPGDYYEAPQSALKALSQIAPTRARTLILAELVKDKTWLDARSLALLEAKDVTPMDDALIERLAKAQRPGGWNPQLSMSAIARFATPEALPRVRAIYESQETPCQPELMAYFVRVDPEYAAKVFHSHPWDMTAAPPRCTVQYFNRTAPLAMGPPLEDYLATYLGHRDVYVKTTAAQSLTRYGGAAALPRVWAAFRYFHEYWDGKAAELSKNGEGVQLELALRNAIARGRGWLANEADLRSVESMCVSGQCIQQTREDLDYWKRPLQIEISRQAGGISGRVAQYYALEDMAALEAKLAQFPRGTGFVLVVRGSQWAENTAEIGRFAEERGFALVRP